MKLTEEQIQLIIDDAVKTVNECIENILDDSSSFQCYEDELGRVYNYGYKHVNDYPIDEIGYALTCFHPDSDICISALMDGDIDFRDTYDGGDYWTPPSGGIEIESSDFYIHDMDIQICVYDEETDDYIFVEVSDEEKQHIIDEVNKNIN